MSDLTIALPESPRPRGSARQSWAERLARFPGSGLSPAQFCAQEGVSLASFYAWRRRLAGDDPGHTRNHTDPSGGPRLLPVHLTVADSLIELVLATGMVVRLRPGCDLAFVRALVQTLGGLPC